MSYPADIRNCDKGPALGGLPIKELREVAKNMGINVVGLRKTEICLEIEKKILNADFQQKQVIPLKKIVVLEDKRDPLEDLKKLQKWLGTLKYNFSIKDLQNLDELELENDQIETLPAEIGNLKKMRRLFLSRNKLKILPEEIGMLQNLRELHLDRNKLEKLPTEIGRLLNLEVLSLDHNQLQILPKEIGNFQQLRELSLHENQIQTLPEEIGELWKLQVLSLDNNQLKNLPKEIGKLHNLQLLNLDTNQLETLPIEIGKLLNLQVLNLDNNQFQTLPEIGNLQNLKRLNLRWNQLQTLSKEIGKLQKLQELYLNENHLQTLPEEIGKLLQLKELHLDRNPLQTLPKEIGWLQNLHVSAGPDIEKQFRQLQAEFPKLEKGVKVIERAYLGKKQPLLVDDQLGQLRRIKQKESWSTDWQEICRFLDKEYKLTELRTIAEQVGIPDAGSKSKRVICAALAQDFQDFQEEQVSERTTRNCHNQPIIEEDYDLLPENQLVTFIQNGQKYCFSLEELTGLPVNKLGNKLNPYTNAIIPEDVLLELARKKQAFETQPVTRAQVRAQLHQLQLREVDPKEGVRRQLIELLNEIQKESTYLPYDKLFSIDRKTLNELASWLVTTTDARYPKLEFDKQVDLGAQNGLIYLIKQLIGANLGLGPIGTALSVFYEQQQ